MKKDPREALRLFQGSASAGDATAQFNLAGMYLRGIGVKESRGEALGLLRKASEGGLDAASRLLGEMNMEEGDLAEARRCFELAVSQGSYRALMHLGKMYRDGVGGNVDRVRALMCFLKLLDIDNGDGFHEAHDLVWDMTDDEIREGAQLAGRRQEGEVLVDNKKRGKR
ncbi:hypothetical protein GT044_33010 [Streptomyces sp. SID335]|nr:hypothetical protein [Streptomyces sp. SID335]MYZ19372.1 hypothetical protein [Streptomyces sp. SID337]NDZ87086.1 sel1 repeat family protein [Streptomyces sp. SID10115]NDZ99142.1 sel1 repeat family protein [Streptomyces sp. SID10116]NEB43574.1 sel1 repeat family protein [Streptomyces sp. SID339]